MLNDYLQIYNLSIVIAGEFNPIITQPFWLSSKKLIREQEAQNAKVEIMHPEVVKFSLDWVKVEATRWYLNSLIKPSLQQTQLLVL